MSCIYKHHNWRCDLCSLDSEAPGLCRPCHEMVERLAAIAPGMLRPKPATNVIELSTEERIANGLKVPFVLG